MISTAAWWGFNSLIVVLLAVDLFFFQRNEHEIKTREAVLLSIFWIGLALLFNVFVWVWKGPQMAMEFLAGYLIEKSLSVDNLFVFIVIFSYFRVPAKYQPKILIWGVLGALVMRALFIFAGVTLLHRFEWLIYIFGGFLVFTGIKMAFSDEGNMDPGKNPVLRLARRVLPIAKEPREGLFFFRDQNRWWVSPLFIVLLVVETTDVVFALDSIPAVLAISRHPFIVYSSNVFAILGLRALYFALAGLMRAFHFLKYGLAFILSFVGVKMIVSSYVKIPIGIALGVVGGVLAISVVASLIFPKPEPPEESHA